jgi:mRNA interferase YafQ
VSLLLSDEVLPENNRDHGLSGDWSGYRECHIKPDLLLIYRKPDANTLRLARLGSHSQLFGCFQCSVNLPGVRSGAIQ